VMVNHTPGSAVTAGDVLVIGETCRIAHTDIAADELGALAAGGGVYLVDCIDTAGISNGTKVYWDDVSNGVTKDITAGGAPFGFAVEAGTVGNAFLCQHAPEVS
jgi:predicted RecA/RadA family phage recombinase